MTLLKPVPDRLPPPPEHLAIPTQQWWTSVVREYQLEQHHLRLLQLAADAWDRAQQAREAIREHGLTYETPNGPRARPEVGVERDSRIGFSRMLREIDLDISAPSSDVRPPPLRSNSRRY
jgi:phage terminase small subunit